MGFHLIAIGNAESIRGVVGDRLFAEKGDTVVVSVAPSDVSVLSSQLEELGARVFSMARFSKILTGEQRLSLLKAYDTSTVYEWLGTGSEYFGISHSSEYELLSIRGKEVAVVNQVDAVSGGQMSSTGAIVGFIRGAVVSLHVNESLDKLNDFRFSELVESVRFDGSDSLLAVSTVSTVHVYRIRTSEELLSFPKQDFFFAGDRIHLSDGSYALEGPMESPSGQPRHSPESGIAAGHTTAKVMKAEGSRIARFIDGKLQKVVYYDGEKEHVKNQTNITAIEFHFSDSRLYAVITKNIAGVDQYMIESYFDGDITINKLDALPESIAVFDTGFVLSDSTRHLLFYQRERYSFTVARRIKKDGSVLVSASNGLVAVYDSSSRTMEFYDRPYIGNSAGNNAQPVSFSGYELRAVHSHNGCNTMLWSDSGRYLAGIGLGDDNTALQIYNSNGKLLYKKTYSRVHTFQWRPTGKLREQEKRRLELAALEEESAESAEAEDDELDTATLLSEWKAYLLSKIQQMKAEQ